MALHKADLDKTNVAFILGMVAFVLIIGLVLVIFTRVPWWIALGPGAVFGVLAALGLYSAVRGWGPSRHEAPRGRIGGGGGWSGGGGSARGGSADFDD